MSIHPYHAWTLARLLAGLAADVDSQAMPDPFGTIARSLAESPPDGRPAVWDGFLAGRDDRDEIIVAVSDADPEGPKPEAPSEGDDGGDDWGPIRLGAMPPAVPFPLDILPIPARDLAEAAARSIGCPVDYPAVATLAAASGVIGQLARLRVKAGYFESASLYLTLVGAASSGKSPALRRALAPIWEIAQKLHSGWKKALDDWKASPEDGRGTKPRLPRITTSDPTVEALGPILAANPRGLVVVPDETTKWIMSMDQYKGGRGGDRPFYLSAWGGEPVTIDRAKHADEPIMVPHPFLTVVGGMTPGMLSELAKGRGREDGFSPRILFAYPDPVRRSYSEDGVPDEVAEVWHDLMVRIWDRPMRDLDGEPTAHVVAMTPEARVEWATWCQAHRDEQGSDDFPDSLEAAWGKLEAYAARLALILHFLDLAADPTVPSLGEIPDLPRRIIRDAVRLVAYFKAQVRRVRAATGRTADQEDEDVRALLGWIGRNRRERFTEKDIGNDFDRFKPQPAALADALAWMTARNIVRRRPEPRTGKVGRKPSPSYEVNPALWMLPRFLRFLPNPDRSGGNEGNEGDSGVGR